MLRSNRALRRLLPSHMRRGFATLDELTSRNRAIVQTEKVCQAMQTIAASKLPYYEESLGKARPYAETLEAIWRRRPDEPEPEPEAERLLIIQIGTTRGLCGATNSGLKRRVQRDLLALPDDTTYRVYAFGDRARRAFSVEQAAGLLEGSVLGLDSLNTVGYDMTADVVERAIKTIDYEYDKIFVYYNKYVNKVTSLVTRAEIPSKEKAMQQFTERLRHYKIEDGDSEHQDMENMWEVTLTNCLHSAILENMTAEQSARMMAMDSAVKNARDMLLELTIEINGMRQGAITAELLEVISGRQSMEVDD